MPTLRLADSQKPGVNKIKRFVLMLLSRGDVDLAQLRAALEANPMFRPVLVAQAIQELVQEGKIEQV